MSWVGDPLNVGQDNLCLRNPSGSLQYWASDDQYSDSESVVFLISVFFCASAFFFSAWVFFFQFPFFFVFFFPFETPLEVNGVVGGLLIKNGSFILHGKTDWLIFEQMGRCIMCRSGIRMQCYWKKSCIISTIGEASTAAWITKGVLETGIAWTIRSLGHGSTFYH